MSATAHESGVKSSLGMDGLRFEERRGGHDLHSRCEKCGADSDAPNALRSLAWAFNPR
jgi:hypothetical protein